MSKTTYLSVKEFNGVFKRVQVKSDKIHETKINLLFCAFYDRSSSFWDKLNPLDHVVMIT